MILLKEEEEEEEKNSFVYLYFSHPLDFVTDWFAAGGGPPPGGDPLKPFQSGLNTP